MITDKKTANAMAGKTARACDSCLRKRARWFCAADDAFLCQACDTSVHSANQLASRHERVRLQTSSHKGNYNHSHHDLHDDECSPAWHRGFTRKARTPRHNNKPAAQQAKYDDVEKVLSAANHRHDPLPFVPEMSNEEESPITDENEEEQLLYRVPVFDPFAAELCNSINGDDDERAGMTTTEKGKELGQQDYGKSVISTSTAHEAEFDHEIHGFLPSELELAEFAADVESLLGGGLEDHDQSCQDINGLELELLGCKEEDDFDIDIDVDVCINPSEQRVKVKEEKETCVFHETANSPMVQTKKRDIILRLNYEAVIAAWASQGSPWTTGNRPDFNPDDGWPDCLDVCHTDHVGPANGDSSRGGLGLGGVGGSVGDGGREARVSRYREKRRTRLFSKKIRYEVRKLNAEKRPRMKGRFVKRTFFMSTVNNSTNSTSFPYQLMMSK
ncbi:Zinc finger protein CONSTANS-LIKE 16 [Morus notabilis]|uniref:Zinc finger protein CONSTANS-LIKE 16 n=1 Tax=Morus notabilis TaxID=981085 RepID=W9R7M1_9ROSA|nr:zinc finger protein CONSTANS-LIKE 16 [Morus notabilis]EXB56925.1 Zinc finger protein CONSTANS-LIKE 16 [Morus notabilis]